MVSTKGGRIAQEGVVNSLRRQRHPPHPAFAPSARTHSGSALTRTSPACDSTGPVSILIPFAAGSAGSASSCHTTPLRSSTAAQTAHSLSATAPPGSLQQQLTTRLVKSLGREKHPLLRLPHFPCGRVTHALKQVHDDLAAVRVAAAGACGLGLAVGVVREGVELEVALAGTLELWSGVNQCRVWRGGGREVGRRCVV